MNFDEIFAEYYTLYRGQATVPGSTDREYILAIQLANNAIRKWDRADGTLWNELYTTAQDAAAGDLTVVTGTTTYTTPDDVRKPGGIITFSNTAGTSSRRLQASFAKDSDVLSTNTLAAYFTGSPQTGFTLHLQGNLTSYNGYDLDYIYYRKPVMIEDGDSVPDMSDPNFMIQDMLASRFANSRNGFGFQTAKANATDALRNMIIENNSGVWGNGMDLTDNSGAGFGQSQYGSII